MSVPLSKRITTRRGLTYVELTIGMAITCVLMLALSTFAVAVSTGWRHSQEEFKLRSSGARGVTQIQDALGNMLCIAQVKPGDTAGASAYLFCWKSDTWNGSPDKKAQFGEMALIEYDPTTKGVWLYQAKDFAAMTASEKTLAADVAWGSDYEQASMVAYFKGSSMVAARKPLVGGFFSSTSNGVQVVSALFGSFAANNGKPIASYRLMIGDAISATSAYGNVALRAAQTPSNLQ